MAKKSIWDDQNNDNDNEPEDEFDDGLDDRPLNTSKDKPKPSGEKKSKPFGFDGRNRDKKKKAPRREASPDRANAPMYNERNMPKGIRRKKQDWLDIPVFNFPDEKPQQLTAVLISTGIMLLLTCGSVPLGIVAHGAFFVLTACSVILLGVGAYYGWQLYFTPWPVFQVSREGIRYVNRKGNLAFAKWENFEDVLVDFPVNSYTDEPEPPILLVITRGSDNKLRRNQAYFSYFDADVIYLRELSIAAFVYVVLGLRIKRPYCEELGIEDELYSLEDQ